MKPYNFFAPTRVLFGEGQLSNLHTLPMPGKKALLVISNGKSTITNGSLDRTQEELKKAGCSAEFIVLSGYAEFSYAKKAIELGVRDFITKPVEANYR